MKNFTTPVSMKVTDEQFRKDLYQPLLDLGYKYSDSRLIPSRICTNFAGNNDLIDIDNKGREDEYYKRYYIDHYNPELFLALAGMTQGDDWQIGEYLYYSYEDEIFECLGKNGNNHELGLASCPSLYRKATKEELINKFSKTNKTDNDMNTKKLFPLQLSPTNAQRIIDIACSTWKSKLANNWAENIVLNKTIDIHQENYETMRKACTPSQNALFDEIFGKDVKEAIYVRGQRFRSPTGGDYILCCHGESNREMTLNNLSDGNAYTDNVKVKSTYNITQAEFDRMCGSSTFTLIS